MKFNPANHRRNVRSGILGAAILLGTTFRADGDESQQDENVTSQITDGGPATGTGTGPGVAPDVATAKAAKVSTKVNEETLNTTAVHEELGSLMQNQEEAQTKANTYTADIAELIAREKLTRPVIVKTLMVKRHMTIESAASMSSRLLTLSKDAEAIAGLRDGTLTVRNTLYKPKKDATKKVGDGTSADGGGTQGQAGTKKSDTETKEQKYNNSLAEFVKHAKASGFELRIILLGVKGALTDAGIK